MELKRKVVGALGWISNTIGKMKRYNVLLEWIEQQHREIASDPADTENEGGQARSKRASSKKI